MKLNIVRTRILILMGVFLVGLNAKAEFYEFEKWMLKNGNMLYLHSDAHNQGTQAVRDQQRARLIQFAKYLGEDTLVIVEDMLNAWNRPLSEEKELKSPCCLNNLTDLCLENGIQVQNVEFRILHKSALDETKYVQEEEKMKECFGEERFKEYFGKCYAYQANSSCGISFNNLFKNASKDPTAFHENCAIIDLKILAMLLENTSRRNILIAAGGDHIASMRQLLPEIGYESVGWRAGSIHDYLKTGELMPDLVLDAQHYRYMKQNPDYRSFEGWSELRKEVYENVLQDLSQIEQAIAQIQGSPKSECPFGNEVEGENGYIFKRWDWIGRHVIEITRKKDRFFLEIGVHHQGDLGKMGNDVQITGYFFENTNGSLSEIQEALKSTERFFPKTRR